MKELVGKTIRSVVVNADQSMLRFVCDDGPVTFKVSGDCCSGSWFADIVGYQALAGHTVREVEDVPLEEGKPAPDDVPTSIALTAKGRTHQDCDAIYGYVVTTEAGRCTIAFRNGSNGYYGGELEATTGEPAGTVWTPITDDWSAS